MRGTSRFQVSPIDMKSSEARGLAAFFDTRVALLKETIVLAKKVSGWSRFFAVRLPRTVMHDSFGTFIGTTTAKDGFFEHLVDQLLDTRSGLNQRFHEQDRRTKSAASNYDVCIPITIMT